MHTPNDNHFNSIQDVKSKRTVISYANIATTWTQRIKIKEMDDTFRISTKNVSF